MAFHREADDPSHTSPQWTLMQHQELKPAMRCWEILTVAPQRRCREADMRLESCPRHDRNPQIKRPKRFCVSEASVKISRHISAWSICSRTEFTRAGSSQIETLL